MMRPIPFFLALLVQVASASVTAGWKVQVEEIVPGFKDNAKVRKQGNPPGESTFFLPGDVLWDLSKVLQIKSGIGAPFEEPKVITIPWTGDWVVWNPRSRMAIASGSRNDLLIAERVFAPDVDQIFFRTQLEWSRGTTPGIFRKLSGRWCSAEKAKIEADGAGAELECWSLGRDLKVNFGLTWPGAEAGSRWEIASACITREGKLTRLVSHGSGDERWLIHGTISRELEDGTPLSERRWIEKEGKQRGWLHPGGEPDVLPIDGALSLVRYDVPEDFLTRGEALPAIMGIEAPENLRDSVRGRFMDAKGFLRHHGVALRSPGSFAGYDPLLSVLVVIAAESDHDICRKITAASDGYQDQNLQIDASVGPSSFGFACQAGMKALISHRKGEVEDLAFEVEPGWGEKKLDLSYTLDMTLEERAPQRFSSTANFTLGVGQAIGRYRLSGGEEREVTLSVSDLQP